MSPRDPAVAALQRALSAEHAAVYGYGVVGAHLTGSRRASAAADWVAHQRARDRIEAMVRSRGGQPTAAAADYRLPVTVRAPAQAVALAVIIEDRTTTTYLGLVAVASPQLRQFAGMQVRACALRAASWRGSTVAFPGLS